SSTVRYRDPVAAARGFAVDFAGFTKPLVGEFRAGDASSGEVDIRTFAKGPVTTVLVRQLGSSGDWWVLGCVTASIQISKPSAGASVSSPLHLAGRSTAFEAQVAAEIRQDGSTTPLGTGFVMGGANGEMGPFDGSLTFRTPTATGGALVLRTYSAKDGTVLEAAVLRVRFAP